MRSIIVFGVQREWSFGKLVTLGSRAILQAGIVDLIIGIFQLERFPKIEWNLDERLQPQLMVESSDDATGMFHVKTMSELVAEDLTGQTTLSADKADFMLRAANDFRLFTVKAVREKPRNQQKLFKGLIGKCNELTEELADSYQQKGLYSPKALITPEYLAKIRRPILDGYLKRKVYLDRVCTLDFQDPELGVLLEERISKILLTKEPHPFSPLEGTVPQPDPSTVTGSISGTQSELLNENEALWPTKEECDELAKLTVAGLYEYRGKPGAEWLKFLNPNIEVNFNEVESLDKSGCFSLIKSKEYNTSREDAHIVRIIAFDLLEHLYLKRLQATLTKLSGSEAQDVEKLRADALKQFVAAWRWNLVGSLVWKMRKDNSRYKYKSEVKNWIYDDDYEKALESINKAVWWINGESLIRLSTIDKYGGVFINILNTERVKRKQITEESEVTKGERNLSGPAMIKDAVQSWRDREACVCWQCWHSRQPEDFDFGKKDNGFVKSKHMQLKAKKKKMRKGVF